MLVKNLLKTVAPLAMIFMISCGDDAKETIKNLEDAPEIQGESMSSCSAAGIEGLVGISKKDVLILLANQSEFQTRYYSDTNCLEAKEVGRVTYKGDFAVERKSLDDQQNVGDITFEIKKAFVEPFSDTLVTTFNTLGFCGRSDYIENETTEVTSGSDNTLCPVSDVPAVLYGQYKYDDANNRLLLSADPVDMDFNKSIPSLPLIDIFAAEYIKQ